ncbi:MAG: bifunctional UDP-N-acetylglucosamine pyrophosphorylase / Glucosamine-1-phosphate N-acetyltransferase [Candidatus Tokpelaia sp. JSC085]|nr:MAG: bifunctional UDP-N-acetylglucosamine pyrophosphorylase / Glucosamine-1-phosphate N-acetyltransferase [Candidatus Tokpelaia sp. JSC085]
MLRTFLPIVLAAGEGRRMKSVLPKMLHKIGGLPLICHVVRTIKSAGAEKIAVVVGSRAEAVTTAVKECAANTLIFHQKEQRGTAHAVLAARAALQNSADDILIAFGDTPLLAEKVLLKIQKVLADGADIVVTGFRINQPAGYGRLIEEKGRIIAIVEEKDASIDEKKITFCNGGLMAIKKHYLLSLLNAIRPNNSRREYYLTDIVKIATQRGLYVKALEVPMVNAVGINNCAELANAEIIWQRDKRQTMMLAGVVLQAPESVFFSYDTEIAADVVIEPHVFFGPGVKIAAGTTIRAFSHIEGASIGANAEIGPYARLRPDVDVHSNVKIGNFCEIKKAMIGSGTKINHLTYIGNTEIGTHVNIGAGTITCNYDGYNKQQTKIGDGAFIGSNTSLVAPISIGNHSYIASGSVITKNVLDDELAFGRARQVNKPGQTRVLHKKTTKNKVTL